MDKLYSNPKNAKDLYPYVIEIKYEVNSLDIAIKKISDLIKKHYST